MFEIILIRPNEIQQYVVIYLLQHESTCMECLSHPSSGVRQTVTAASGTSHSVRATTFRLSHPSSGVRQIVTAASGTGQRARVTTFRQRGLIRPRFYRTHHQEYVKL